MCDAVTCLMTGSYLAWWGITLLSITINPLMSQRLTKCKMRNMELHNNNIDTFDFIAHDIALR